MLLTLHSSTSSVNVHLLEILRFISRTNSWNFDRSRTRIKANPTKEYIGSQPQYSLVSQRSSLDWWWPIALLVCHFIQYFKLMHTLAEQIDEMTQFMLSSMINHHPPKRRWNTKFHRYHPSPPHAAHKHHVACWTVHTLQIIYQLSKIYNIMKTRDQIRTYINFTKTNWPGFTTFLYELAKHLHYKMYIVHRGEKS